MMQRHDQARAYELLLVELLKQAAAFCSEKTETLERSKPGIAGQIRRYAERIEQAQNEMLAASEAPTPVQGAKTPETI